MGHGLAWLDLVHSIWVGRVARAIVRSLLTHHVVGLLMLLDDGSGSRGSHLFDRFLLYLGEFVHSFFAFGVIVACLDEDYAKTDDSNEDYSKNYRGC